jgi:hypothetical protein
LTFLFISNCARSIQKVQSEKKQKDEGPNKFTDLVDEFLEKLAIMNSSIHDMESYSVDVSETQSSGMNTTTHRHQVGQQSSRNNSKNIRSSSSSTTSTGLVVSGSNHGQQENMSRFALGSSSFTNVHQPPNHQQQQQQKQQQQDCCLVESNQHEDNSSTSFASTMEQQIQSQKLQITENAANELHVTLTKLKDVAKTMLHEMNAYLDETEKVEIDYLKCQESLKKEAKRLSEVEPDIAGTTNYFKFDLN